MPADGSSALVAGGSSFSLWLGPEPHEAAAAYKRARSAGMTSTRALVVGQIGSFRDCWQFRKRIAFIVGTSVRTVQRAISEAKSKGLIGVARGKKHEIPPGAERVIPCGWSHRWAIGWGRAGRAVQEAIAAARLRFVARASISPKGGAPRTVTPRLSTSTQAPPRRTWTAEELDRELERQAPMAARVARARARAPDEPPD